MSFLGSLFKRKPGLVGFSLRWVHPRLPESQAGPIIDRIVAEKFAELFEGYNKPSRGKPFDCPMYDVIVTLHSSDGISNEIKVYLPRLGVFPGMWKHPDGPLFYFNIDRYHCEVIGELLQNYIPPSAVYTRNESESEPVEFRQGMPNFREINWPILGEYSPEMFARGSES